MRRRLLLTLLSISAFAASLGQAQEAEPEAEKNGWPTEYVIGVEDVLNVVTWGEPELSLTAKVRPDGRITIPLVNDVMVAGSTPMEVRERIADGLAAFINAPNVTVIVEEINSFRVYFLGEVRTQGPVQFYRETRLLQGIATAGGLTEFAKKNITVLREEYGIERRIEIDYKKLWAGNPGQENIRLLPGDTVLVK
jgi:polysaccharide export outer membrane protein